MNLSTHGNILFTQLKHKYMLCQQCWIIFITQQCRTERKATALQHLIQRAWPNGGSTLPVSVGSWLHRSKGNLSCPLPILPRLRGSCPRESGCRWGSPPCDQTSGCLWLLCRKTPAREAVHTGRGEECCSASPVEEGAAVFTSRGGLASLSWAASHPCLYTQLPRLLLTAAIMLNSKSSFSRNPKWITQTMLYAHSLHWQVTWTPHN